MSKVEVKSLALPVVNYVVQEVVFYSTIVFPRSAYQQPLVLLVLVPGEEKQCPFGYSTKASRQQYP